MNKFKSVGGYPFALFVYNQRVTLYAVFNLCFLEKKFVKYLLV